MKNTNKEPIVMRDSPEAARLITVTGWVSRQGQFFGQDESIARYAGCTHDRCKHCGEPVVKHYTACDSCRNKKEIEAFNAMPRKPWDGTAMVYSQANDKYYTDPSDADDDLEEGQTLADLRLVICEPNHARLLDIDFFTDELPEDGDLPAELETAMEAFNAVAAKCQPLSWSPGKFALEIERMKIYCDGVAIDVNAEYRKRGFDKLPPTTTMTAFDIRQAANRPANRQVWLGMTPLKDSESVALTDGMKFISVPPAHY